MDTGDRSTLLAAERTVDEITEFIGADSLVFLDLDSLLEATGVGEEGFCTACLCGRYPTAVPTTGDKFLLERS